MEEMKNNAAVEILFALRAYCPKVKIANPIQFEIEQQRAKRRKRPLIARGNYGKNLMSHFDEKRRAAKKK